MEQQQADALGLLAETALHHGIDPGAPGERYQVVVHVDAPAPTRSPSSSISLKSFMKRSSRISGSKRRLMFSVSLAADPVRAGRLFGEKVLPALRSPVA